MEGLRPEEKSSASDAEIQECALANNTAKAITRNIDPNVTKPEP